MAEESDNSVRFHRDGGSVKDSRSAAPTHQRVCRSLVTRLTQWTITGQPIGCRACLSRMI